MEFNNMAVTNADIQAWLQANPSASDSQIASTMKQYGVTANQMAQATGLTTDAVNQRLTAAAPNSTQIYGSNYNTTPNISSNYSLVQNQATSGATPTTHADRMNLAAISYNPSAPNQYNSGFSNQDVTGWLTANPNATDQQIATTMLSTGVSPLQVADATGTNINDINNRFTNALRANANLAPIEQGNEYWSNLTLPSQQATVPQAPTVEPRPTNPLTNQQEMPSWMNEMQSWWNGMQQQQQAPSSYTSQAFPQYTPNYGNNALMRPITQGSNITAQNQYGNMGYNNKRSSLWGDW
jgi:hypothetical protein